ncbi:MAG: maleylpyruvate isomerase N-terminal domain-containing protein, partial [Ilumatobacteraceae bacterium]
MRSICDDLAAEHGDLDALVAGLDDRHWLIETPSPGWSVRDQISHLWF